MGRTVIVYWYNGTEDLACTVVRMVIVHVCDYVYIQYAAITILTPTHYIHSTPIFTVPHNAPPFLGPL